MATVIDRLVVELGLDPKQFTKGQKEAAASLVKTREVAEKHGAGIEKSMDGAAQAVDRLARNALKLFALLTAGRAVKDFVQDVTSADAALGRLAKSIGSTPEVISSLGNAVARNGGSANAAAGSFERLADSINEIKTTGNSSILPYLYRLQGLGGKQINLNKEMSETFGDLAENAKNIADKQGVPFATYLLKQAGVDRDTAALLVQGREKYNKALAESRKIGIVRKEDTEAAQKLQTSVEGLRQTSESLGRGILTGLTPTITRLLDQFQAWIDKNRGIISTKIAEYVERFAKWIESINWAAVGRGVEGFVSGAAKIIEALGGITRLCEIFFVYWAGSKAIKIVAGILKIAGLMGSGPLGWAIRLAMVASVAADSMSDKTAAGAPGNLAPEGAGAVGGVLAGPGPAGPGNNPHANEGYVDRIKRRWRERPRFLGGTGQGDDAMDGIHRRALRGARKRDAAEGEADKTNYNFTGDNANVLKQAAAEIGTSPKDLATVISYETAGKFSPSIWGGQGGSMLGLIQFNRENQRKYGVHDKQTFAEQMPAVVKYMKDRGFKPGMSLNQLYATINGGNPYVSQNTSDGNGTIAQHVERMRVGHAARVDRFLGSEAGVTAPPSPNTGAPHRPEILASANDERRKQEAPTVAEALAGVRAVKAAQREREQGTLAERAAAGSKYGPQTPYPGSRSLQQMNDWLWDKKGAQPTDWRQDKDTGNWRPVFAPGPGASLDARRASAIAAIAQVNAAQTAMIARTTNDNRSTSNTTSETTFNGGIHVSVPGGDAAEIARSMDGAIRRRAFAQATNYARA